MTVNERQKLSPLVIAGLVTLVVAGILDFFGHFHSRAGDSFVSFLFGVAAALLLFGLLRAKRKDAGGTNDPRS
jgi:hypothetical protein